MDGVRVGRVLCAGRGEGQRLPGVPVGGSPGWQREGGVMSAEYRAAREAAYCTLAWEGQRRYLEAVDGMTDRDVRRRVLMLARLLKRWARGW